MQSDSAFISPTDFTNHFSNIQLLEERKHNVLYTAQRHGRTFILKALKAEYADIAEYQLAQEKEFRLGISLNHPNIAATYSLEQVPDIGRCIVEEYIDGITLGNWLKDSQQSGVSSKHRILHQLLDALEYLHSQQKVHHDLKPSNILITHNGQNLKLIDFGLSDTDDSTTTAANDPKKDIIALGNIIVLLFPHRYKHIAKHCQQGKYLTIAAVRTTIKRAYYRRIFLPILLIILLTISATIALLKFDDKQQPTITYEQIDQHLQSVYDSLSAIAIPIYELETIITPPIVKQQTIIEHTTDTVHIVQSTLSYNYADIEYIQQTLLQPYYDSLSTPIGQYKEMAIHWLGDFYTVQLQVRDSILHADFEKGSVDYQMFQNAWLNVCTSLATAFHDSIIRLPSINDEYQKGNLTLEERDSLNAIWQSRILKK